MGLKKPGAKEIRPPEVGPIWDPRSLRGGGHPGTRRVPLVNGGVYAHVGTQSGELCPEGARPEETRWRSVAGLTCKSIVRSGLRGKTNEPI
ncbi:hypothetical protein JTE90_009131 [Oedothorax gibbosus]|uniref:Uncharacterized protein n=1 Tax=Oedothorax gibbosus TaxID=931172 RepID=A0AAV6TCN1_9ARAC|nr:hypothetical protein JTE90_009131 [Oedothorax gibbosus]